MTLLPPGLQYLALQPQLTHRLRDAIDRLKHNIQKAGLDIPQWNDCTSQPAAFSSQAVSFDRAKDLTQVIYSSPIALRLSRSWNLPAIDLAKQIAAWLDTKAFAETEPPVLKKSWEHLVTRVTPPGWIVVKPSDRGIALWLQTLADQHSQMEAEQSANDSNAHSKSDHALCQNANSLFEIQYAHARCCTLLNMGIQSGLISSSHFRTSSLAASGETRSTFPWLADNDTLRLQNRAEKYLIGQLFVTLDQLSTHQQCASSGSDRRAIGLRLAESLSERIEDFYAVCRIFGDVQVEQLELAQARLGLILASKTLLSFILQWLEVAAPTEL